MESLGKFPDPFLAEIAGQPDAIRRAARGVADQVDDLAHVPSISRPTGSALFTGMGASYAASLAPVTVLAESGIRASRVDAAELLHFRLGTIGGETVLVLVSQSGRSAELVGLLGSLDDGTGPGRPFVVSVTNGRANPLAESADAALDIRAGEERGPSTMTFAATVVTLAALAGVLSGNSPGEDTRSVRSEAERAAGAAEALIDEADDRGAWMEDWLGGRTRLVVVGRGTGFAAAEMGALLLKEAAGMPAEAIGSGQFRHGPIELAGPDLAVAIVATERATSDLDVRLASDLVEMGVAVLFIGSNAVASGSGARVMEIPEVARGLEPALAVLPLQLLAWRLSVRRGSAPGRLRIASKVTTHE